MVPACSADALEEPEPAVETPGAIVVMENDDHSLQLMQTQGITGFGMGDPILFVDLYQDAPRTFAEARVMARDPNLRVRTKDYFIALVAVVSAPHEVVWFRTLAP